jgi:hypothetical protein
MRVSVLERGGWDGGLSAIAPMWAARSTFLSDDRCRSFKNSRTNRTNDVDGAGVALGHGRYSYVSYRLRGMRPSGGGRLGVIDMTMAGKAEQETAYKPFIQGRDAISRLRSHAAGASRRVSLKGAILTGVPIHNRMRIASPIFEKAGQCAGFGGSPRICCTHL